MRPLLGRRNVLAGLLAGAACGLAKGEGRADPPPPGRPPKRLVLVMTPNGTQQANFWPRGDFTSPILEPILSVPALARRATIVRGISIPNDLSGADGNEHDVGFTRMFTGERIILVGGAPWAGAPSVDQILGKRWNSEPLNLAVLCSKIEPFPKPGFNHRTSFSYLAPGVLRVPFVDPFAAYAATFGLETGALDDTTRRRYRDRARVLAFHERELDGLRSRLGPIERGKVDMHHSAAGELARRLSRVSSGVTVNCAARPRTPRNWSREDPAKLTTDEAAIPELTTSMIDLLAASFACDLTRVATLQLGYAGAKWMFDWEGLNVDVHQEYAHRDRKDEGVAPDVTDLLVRVHRWYATQVADLAKKLDAIPEGDGTVLDNTLLVWTSDIGRGDHDLHNVPLVLLGGAGAGLAGRRFIDRGEQPFQRVGCTILRAMGEVAAGFGDAPACGPLSGVLD